MKGLETAERVERAAEMVDALASEEGFRRWLEAQRFVHSFSWTNGALIAVQAHVLGVTPYLVQAAWRWKKAGYHPAKGSTAMWIWTFRGRRGKDGRWTCCAGRLSAGRCPGCGKTDHYFKLGPVFAAEQVRSFEDGSTPPPPPHPLPIAGDELGHLVAPIMDRALAEDWIATFTLGGRSEHGEQGFYRPKLREVQVHASMPDGRVLSGNEQLHTALHELCHARRAEDGADKLDYASEEVVVDVAAMVAAAGLGLDTSGFSVPYVGGWGRANAATIVRSFMPVVADLAKRVSALAEPPESEEDHDGAEPAAQAA